MQCKEMQEFPSFPDFLNHPTYIKRQGRKYLTEMREEELEPALDWDREAGREVGIGILAW